jgi:uncharacterized protein
LRNLFRLLGGGFERWLGARSTAAQWAVLLGLSVGFAAALEALRLPAALLLGPMLAAILLAAAETRTRVSGLPFFAAQAVIGAMIARGLPVSILADLRKDWLLFAVVILLVVTISTSLGYLLARWQVLPGTTAIWGASPGGASAMVLMSDAYGADMRLVAFMQYLRVVFVATLASVVAALWTAGAGGAPAVVWFPPVDWPAFGETLAVIACGAVLAQRLRIPAGALLGPMAFAVVLQGAGLLTIELPPWLLAASYALIGWTIGLRFTRQILAHAARAMPLLVAAVLVLIALCGGLAYMLVALVGVDPLTAYLATSPGGMDSVAIIAATSNVNVPFVMAMQACRLIVVLAASPALTRFLAGRIKARQAASAESDTFTTSPKRERI